VKLKRAFHPII